MKIGPSEGNSGAIVRWGRHLDNGIWLAWKHWNSRNLLMRFRVRRGHIAIGLLDIAWGNK